MPVSASDISTRSSRLTLLSETLSSAGCRSGAVGRCIASFAARGWECMGGAHVRSWKRRRIFRACILLYPCTASSSRLVYVLQRERGPDEILAMAGQDATPSPLRFDKPVAHRSSCYHVCRRNRESAPESLEPVCDSSVFSIKGKTSCFAVSRDGRGSFLSMFKDIWSNILTLPPVILQIVSNLYPRVI